MKRLAILFFLTAHILWIADVHAQEVTVSGITPESFSGVRLAANGERFYIFYMDAAAQDSANVMLKVFDRGMQPKIDVAVPMAKGTELAAWTYNGMFYLAQLVNAGNKTRTTIAIDETGNLFRRKDETDIKASALSAASFPVFYSVGLNDFMAFRTQAGSKPVVEMEGLNMQLESRWTKTFDAETSIDATTLKTEGDRVYFLRKQKTRSKDIYSLQSLIGVIGESLFTTEMREGDRIAAPSYLDVKDGFITTAGVFQSEAGTGKPEGIFYARLNPTGVPEKMHFLPWGLIKTLVKNNLITDLETGKTSVLVQNVVADGNGVTLIGELYNKAAGTEANTATFTVQDFVLVHLNKEGQVDQVSEIDKTEKQLVITGSMSSKTDVELAQWLNKNNFFAYRAVVPVMGKNVIAYFDDNKGKNVANFATIDSTGSVIKENITSVAIDRDQVITEGGKKKDREKAAIDISKAVLNSTEQDLRDFATAQGGKSIMTIQEGHVMIYNYSNPDLIFWIFPVDAR